MLRGDRPGRAALAARSRALRAAVTGGWDTEAIATALAHPHPHRPWRSVVTADRCRRVLTVAYPHAWFWWPPDDPLVATDPDRDEKRSPREILGADVEWGRIALAVVQAVSKLPTDPVARLDLCATEVETRPEVELSDAEHEIARQWVWGSSGDVSTAGRRGDRRWAAPAVDDPSGYRALGPAGEPLIGRDRNGRLLLSFGEDLEQQLSPTAVQFEVSQLVADQEIGRIRVSRPPQGDRSLWRSRVTQPDEYDRS